VLTVHPTLLIGPSDWQRDRMPKEEFLARIEALWPSCPTASQAMVYGNSRHHAELAYLTNLVPKLEPAVALLSRTDEPRLFVGGGPNMLGAARPLTWIADIVPLKELDRVRMPDGVLIGGGYMTTALRRTVGDAAMDATPQLWTHMRRKSAHELAAIREACAALDAAIAAIGEAQKSGASVTSAILAGECAANARGAQDVRTLFSTNDGRTLQPFSMLIERTVDPLQVYVAVRRFNYWAEGFAVLTQRPSPAAERAPALLGAVLPMIKSGISKSSVADFIASRRLPYRCHPVTEGAVANSIGLALEEPPYTNIGATFEAGEVYSLKAGITDGADQHAIVSAMIAVRDNGCDVLWASRISDHPRKPRSEP
jgi:hypothetical protein